MFVNCNCVYLYSLLPGIGSCKKRWSKQQDSNLESFNYEFRFNQLFQEIQTYIKFNFKLARL